MGLVGVGERQPFDPEMGTDLRPVEAAAAGDQDEDVVVIAAPDDDGAQQRLDRDALERRALLGTVSPLGPDDLERDPAALDRLDGRRRVGHRAFAVTPWLGGVGGRIRCVGDARA